MTDTPTPDNVIYISDYLKRKKAEKGLADCINELMIKHVYSKMDKKDE